MQYKFKNDVEYFGYSDDDYPISYFDASDADYAENLKNLIDKDFKEMGPKGLAEYLDKDNFIFKVVNSIVCSLADNYHTLITVVDTTRKLNDEELTELKDYLTGQFADGWGEWLEQQDLGTIYYTEEYEYEDDEGSYVTGEEEKSTDAYASIDWKKDPELISIS